MAPPVGKAQIFDDGICALQSFFLIIGHPRCDVNVFPEGQVIEKLEKLEDKSDVVFEDARTGVVVQESEVPAVEKDLPSVGRVSCPRTWRNVDFPTPDSPITATVFSPEACQFTWEKTSMSSPGER